MNIAIMTDSSCDLPSTYIKENNIESPGLMCLFNEKEYQDDFGLTLTYKEFYEGMRQGVKPVTSQINMFRFKEIFERLVKEGKQVIYIGFDSKLSGTFQSAVAAKQEILETYKAADVTVIDTKSASLGQGLLVYYAIEMLKKGASKEEIINWVNENMYNINHWFYVEDLQHLKRGGRISATKAAVGTLLNIKPIIFLDSEGSLKQVTTIRGKNKAIKYLIEKYVERAKSKDDIVGISHGDCLEDAEELAKLLKEECGVKEVIINHTGMVIGAHVGPGMMSLCFLGKNREIS